VNWTTTFPHRYLLCQRVIRRRKRRQIPGESIFRDSLPDGLSAFYLLGRLSLNGRDLAMRSRDYCYHGRAAWSGTFHRITGTSVRLLTHCSRHGRQRVSCWLMNPQLQLYIQTASKQHQDPIRSDLIRLEIGNPCQFLSVVHNRQDVHQAEHLSPIGSDGIRLFWCTFPSRGVPLTAVTGQTGSVCDNRRFSNVHELTRSNRPFGLSGLIGSGPVCLH